jgi:hypothetical protein
MHTATKTLARINDCLKRDGGAEFRRYLKLAMEEVNDAFDPKPDIIPRKHLGASLIGRPCARYLWLLFRWAFKEVLEGRQIRLFNRGHLEEARFIALLRQAGFRTQHLTDTGKQMRIEGAWGHYGGSLDGVIFDCPDTEGVGLLEFKTSNDKGFIKLKKDGMRNAKADHYVQTNQYMAKMNLQWVLYMSINKNDDELHAEIETLNPDNASHYEKRAEQIVSASTPPPRIAATPACNDCKWCSMIDVCWNRQPVATTCRTCSHAVLAAGGQWVCGPRQHTLTPEQQFAACEHYDRLASLA